MLATLFFLFFGDARLVATHRGKLTVTDTALDDLAIGDRKLDDVDIGDSE